MVREKISSCNVHKSGSGLYRLLTETMLRSFVKSRARSSVLFTAILSLVVGAYVTTRLSASMNSNDRAAQLIEVQPQEGPIVPKKPRKKIEIPLNCTAFNLTQSCLAIHSTTNNLVQDGSLDPPATCPDYFSWIHEDLKPWAQTGITREMVERARRTANFRLVIMDGRAYVETFKKSFQSRDVFTLWGILQMLRMYPKKVPDLELMFDCVDWPVILSKYFQGPNATAPPPLFRYCANDVTLDIVFPDWSFWGWPEINIKPWGSLLKKLQQGNKRSSWMDREPYAYWKGNPAVAPTRLDLLKCNLSEKADWNARVYAQDWIKESQQGYNQSDLASQCMHRYKIYIEGSAWSVSEKYILACDSVTLVVRPRYYDFFTRSLIPLHHYWPIRDDNKCKSIKFAVDWGNSHEQEAQAIGKAASRFIQEELKMEYVYDYMFHLLSEYAKLLRFKPVVPEKAVELCSEAMACTARGLERKFMMTSLVKGPSERNPCAMPSYDIQSLDKFRRRKADNIKQVEVWERTYWENQTIPL